MAILDLTPVQQDIIVERGTDNTLEFHLTTAAAVDVDITNDTVIFTARLTHEGEQKIFLSNGVGEHETPLEGRTRFTLTKTALVVDAGAREDQRVNWVYEVRRVVGATEIVYFAGQLQLDPVVGKGV